MARVLIVDPADFIGGAELYTLDMLSRANTSKNRFFLATGQNEDYLSKVPRSSVRIYNVHLERLKSFSLISLRRLYRSIRALRIIIKAEKIDIVQSNSVRAHILASLAVFFINTRVLWILHDFTFPKFLLRILVRVPYRIVVASEVVREYYRAIAPKRFHSKFLLIPNGIDLDRIQKMPFKGNIRKELNLGEDIRFAGIVGRLDRWKGQDYFLRACAKVHAKLPETRFLIIGTSSEHDPKTVEFEGSLRELVRDLHLEREVFFLGFRDDVFDIIRQMSVLVHASTENEPFGRVVLEAMSLGTPVIASNRGGPVEIIEEGRNGFLVDPQDREKLARTMSRVLEDKRLREKLIGHGLKTVQKHYDLPKIVRRLEKLYE